MLGDGMFTRLALATALLPLLPFARAFYDTVPLVAWSSHENALLGALTEQSRGGVSEGGVETLLGLDRNKDAYGGGVGGDVCDFDALVVFEQPGLHAIDLRHLPSSSSIPARLKAAKRSAQIPYVKRRSIDSIEEISLESTVEEFARRCGASMTWLTMDGFDSAEGDEKKKSVFYLSLPEVYGEGSWRKYRMDEVESSVSRTLEGIESAYPKHLIIYTGSFSSASSPFTKRQSPSIDQTDQPFAFAPSNSSTTEGGILARYQLLTPGLILTLLITLFVLLPVILFSVQALAGIQSSVRLDAPRGVTQSKKQQ